MVPTLLEIYVEVSPSRAINYIASRIPIEKSPIIITSVEYATSFDANLNSAPLLVPIEVAPVGNLGNSDEVVVNWISRVAA
jgi:hypothetical protein